MFKIKSKKQNGFTLIEVLISMTILSLIILSATQSIRSSINVKNSIISFNKNHQSLDFLTKIENDIINIVPEYYPDKITVQDNPTYIVGYSGKYKTYIKFMTNIGVSSDVKKYNLSDVRYIFENGFLKRQIRPFKNMVYTNWQDDIIIENIKSFNVSFYGNEKHYTFFPNPNLLESVAPQGLKINLTTEDGRAYIKWINF